jgi:hypothetical protein
MSLLGVMEMIMLMLQTVGSAKTLVLRSNLCSLDIL